jgi:hypothetical protein
MSHTQFFESELEWLFFMLWNKSSAVPPIFSFHIPQTVIIRENRPQTWYFRSKEGYILKKNACNVTV